jgi:hypothetical protein
MKIWPCFALLGAAFAASVPLTKTSGLWVSLGFFIIAEISRRISK